MNIIIRSIQVHDLPAVNAVLNQIINEKRWLASASGYTLDAHQRLLDCSITNKYPYIVASSEATIIGWCNLLPTNTKTHSMDCCLLSMGLLNEYREQGIGRQLLETCIRDAQSQNIRQIELEVYTDNPIAIALYQSCGFEPQGMQIKEKRAGRPGKYDILAMARNL